MEQVLDDDLVYISTGSEFIVRKSGGTGGGECCPEADILPEVAMDCLAHARSAPKLLCPLSTLVPPLSCKEHKTNI